MAEAHARRADHQPRFAPDRERWAAPAIAAGWAFTDGFSPGTGSLLVFALVGWSATTFCAPPPRRKVINVCTNLGGWLYFGTTQQVPVAASCRPRCVAGNRVPAAVAAGWCASFFGDRGRADWRGTGRGGGVVEARLLVRVLVHRVAPGRQLHRPAGDHFDVSAEQVVGFARNPCSLIVAPCGCADRFQRSRRFLRAEVATPRETRHRDTLNLPTDHERGLRPQGQELFDRRRRARTC